MLRLDNRDYDYTESELLDMIEYCYSSDLMMSILETQPITDVIIDRCLKTGVLSSTTIRGLVSRNVRYNPGLLGNLEKYLDLGLERFLQNREIIRLVTVPIFDSLPKSDYRYVFSYNSDDVKRFVNDHGGSVNINSYFVNVSIPVSSILSISISNDRLYYITVKSIDDIILIRDEKIKINWRRRHTENY